MPTRRFKESINAFFGSHIDSGKYNQIKEAKEDIDFKVDKILELNKDEEADGKDENSLPNSQTELIALIKEFRDQYHTLYAHYDDIIVELGKKVHRKHDEDTSSSSSSNSDSESEYSLKGGKRNGRVADSSKLGLETAHQEADELQEELTTTNEENIALRSQLQEVENALAERNVELSDFQRKFEEEMSKASQQITTLKEELASTTRDYQGALVEQENLHTQFDLLQAQKAELEMEAKNEKQAFSQNLQLAEEMIASLTKTIENLEFAANEKDTAFEKLKGEYKQIEVLLEESQGSHRIVERKMEQTMRELRRTIESKEKVIVDLENQLNFLKDDLETKVDELGSLTDYIRNIEVRLRLRNQKLRVTEQLLTEKEEMYKTTVLKLNSEIKFLQERVAALSAAISEKDEASQKVVSYVSITVHNTLIGVESILNSFEEKYQKHMDCISKVSAELNAVKDWVSAANNEKSKTAEKLETTVQELKDATARESMLTDTVTQLEAKLKVEVNEKEKLTEMAKQLKDNVTEYELSTKVKEDSITCLAEEKREAIKQLCVLIDYHRERCNYFKDIITKMRPVTGAPRST